MKSRIKLNRCRYARLLGAMTATVLVVSACGGGDDDSEALGGSTGSVDADAASEVSEPESNDGDVLDSPDEGVEPSAEDQSESAVEGAGVLLADFCAGGQPLNGAISLEDLVGFGFITSTNATVEGSNAYDATGYETFGFLCNISEDVGTGQNFLTIGLNSGSDIWDLAVEQGDAPVEQMGDWEVMIGSNWLSPLTMRTTDAAGNQDSLFATWTQADGTIPDAATLERLMRPLADAIASRATVDIPRT